MDQKKRKRLTDAGWRVGDAGEFLALTPEESALIEVKLAVADYVRYLRTELGLTQSYVAERMGSSQSRIAKIEAADASVTLDLMIKTALVLGASRRDVGQAISDAAP